MKIALVVMVLAVAVAGIAALTLEYYTNNSFLALNGQRNITVGLNGLYEEPGAKAELAGFDVSDRVKIDGEVDVTKPGEYKLTYSCGNFEMTRTVTVLDRMSPVLELEGDLKINMTLGDKFEEPGYHAEDEDGNDLTAQVEITDNDFNRAGMHNVTYSVTDSKGKTTQLIRKVKIKPNKNLDTPGLPICMFHYVYDEKNPPDDLYDRWGNYIGQRALTEEINWLKSENYYFPTWEEVRAYVEGELILPEKSVVLTFDDCTQSFLDYGIPVMEKTQVPATSFVITSKDGERKVRDYQSDYIYFESHSHDMHHGGGNIGHGGIFTAISHEDGMADLNKSIDILGSHDAFAYPYGDVNKSSEDMVKEAGFLCAVTTQPGKAKPGDDPYRLPRQRMSLDQTLKEFQNKVKP